MPVTLTAVGSDVAPGRIVEYLWDFDGDGEAEITTPGGVITHTFNQSGTFDTIVTVRDDDGLTAIASLRFTLCRASGGTSPTLPHALVGEATIGGEIVADGTQVIAYMGCDQVGVGEVSGGKYSMVIVQPPGESYAGKTVSFSIGGVAAAQTTVWKRGDISVLNLSTP